MKTLFLMPDTWDLAVDSFGNIAVAENPYQAAQDCATECRLWLGEATYDTTKGIPYEQSLLGNLPPPSLVSSWYQDAAESVPNVEKAAVSLIFDSQSRGLSGSISLTLQDGEAVNVNV